MFTFSHLQKAAIILLAAQTTPVPASHSLRVVSNVPAFNITHLTRVRCGGSFWCPRINSPHNYLNEYLQDWIRYGIADGDIYDLGVQIACATVFIWLPPLGSNAYCAYTTASTAADEGSPPAGINGSMIKQKMEELRIGGCFACGKAPWDEEVFKIDYVPKTQVRCGRPGEVICPPTVPSAYPRLLEQRPGPVLSMFNAALLDDEVSLQMVSIQES